MPCSHLLHIHTWTLTIVVEVLLAAGGGNPVCRFPMFTNTRVYRTTMLVYSAESSTRTERASQVSTKMIRCKTIDGWFLWCYDTTSKIDLEKRGRKEGKKAIRSFSRKKRETRAKPRGCSRIPGERERERGELDQLVLDQPPECWKIHRALKRERSKSKEQRAKEAVEEDRAPRRPSPRPARKMREARNANGISRYRSIRRKGNESEQQHLSLVNLCRICLPTT